MKETLQHRVLLVNSNTCASPYPVYPLGIAHLAAALGQAGFATATVDLALGDDLEGAIASFTPDFVGISVRNIDDIRIENTTFFVPALATLIARVRGMSCAPVLLGGSGFSLFPERLLEMSGADYGIAGEGEQSIVSLLTTLTGGDQQGRIGAIPGLVYRTESGVARNPSSTMVPVDVPRALREPRLVRGYTDNSSMVNVQTQRGCAHRCCYCTYPLIEGRCMRARDPDEIAEELLDAKEMGARYFFVVDSVFNSSPDHVASVCDALLRHSVGLPWGCFLRPQGLSSELMALMARAGLTHIEFGSDSYSDRVLASYGKELTFEDISMSSDLALQQGIHHAHFLIVGGPGETADTMREGFRNSLRLKRTVHFAFIGMRIYPATELHRIACEQGVIGLADDLLNPVFYVSSQVSKSETRRLLGEFRAQCPNWILDEPDEQTRKVIAGLRAKGIAGPLWEYLAR